jgi:hypothetical protein
VSYGEGGLQPDRVSLAAWRRGQRAACRVYPWRRLLDRLVDGQASGRQARSTFFSKATKVPSTSRAVYRSGVQGLPGTEPGRNVQPPKSGEPR